MRGHVPSRLRAVVDCLQAARADKSRSFVPGIDPDVLIAKAHYERDPSVSRLPVSVVLEDGTAIQKSEQYTDLIVFHGDEANPIVDSDGRLLNIEDVRGHKVRGDSDQPPGDVKGYRGGPILVPATLKLSAEDVIAALRAGRIPGLLHVEVGARVVPDLDCSLPALYRGGPVSVPAPKARGADEPTGRGVFIGVVDFGCDFAHPNFRNEDGTTRLASLIALDSNGDDVPLESWSRDDINEALQTPNPYSSLPYHPHAAKNQPHAAYKPARFGAHGSIVLDAAAGNGRGTRLPGVAPDADIIFVQLQRRVDTHGIWGAFSVAVAKAVKKIFDTAAEMDPARPVVVNLSLNPQKGPRNGTGDFAEKLNSLVGWNPGQAHGKAIVVSAGNLRDLNLHASGRIQRFSAEQEVPYPLNWVTRLPATHLMDQTLRIYHSQADPKLVIEVELPESFAQAGTRHRLDPGARDSLPQGSDPQDAYLVTDQSPIAAGLLETSVTITKKALERGDKLWRMFLSLKEEETGSTGFYAWVDRNRVCQSALDEAAAKRERTLGDFATAPGVISVGSYYAVMPHGRPRLYSSEGPTEASLNPGEIDPLSDPGRKPAVIAPGHGIHVAKSHDLASPNERLPEDSLRSTIHKQAVIASGTSLAAAHVTGLLALLLERYRAATGKAAVDSDWPTHEEMRRALVETAESADSQGLGRWDPHAGFGRVHAARALAYPFPRILQPQNGEQLPDPKITVSAHVGLGKEDAAEIEQVVAKIFDGDGAPVAEAALIREDDKTNVYSATLDLGTTGSYLLSVEATVTSAERNYSAVPVKFTVG